MRFHSVMMPLMAIGDTYAPALGQPSLTPAEITSLYLKYLQRPPDATEMASEMENANKYSAAGIERQIALRSGNTAGSGVRGDENLPALTIPRPVPVAPVPAVDLRNQVRVESGGGMLAPVGSVATFGPAGTLDTSFTAGPVGLVRPPGNVVPGREVYTSGNFIGGGGAPVTESLPAAAGGLDTTMLLVLAGVGFAAWYLLK